MKIKLPWWHRALRPWFDFVAARRERRRFARVGYFIEVAAASKVLIGVVEASENGEGKRRLKRLQGYNSPGHFAIPKAWQSGDDSAAMFLHPTPFIQDATHVSQ